MSGSRGQRWPRWVEKGEGEKEVGGEWGRGRLGFESHRHVFSLEEGGGGQMGYFANICVPNPIQGTKCQSLIAKMIKARETHNCMIFSLLVTQ